MLSIAVAGETALLHPSGAVYLPARGMALVADAHFGKAVAFRKLGLPVPEATTGGTLQQLSRVVEDTGAREVVFLGDFLHSAQARSPAVLDALHAWREAHPSLRLTLVRGNHDARAGDPPGTLLVRVFDEPFRAGPFALCHHPDPVTDAYVLAGHWHPCVTVRGRAFERLRLPCFWFGDESQPARAVGVLPAFGSFTGMHPVAAQPGDRLFAIAQDAVRALPPG